MDIRPDTVELAKWDVSADVDLATATADAYIGGSWQALTWVGAATSASGTWTRTASLIVRGANGASGVQVTSSTVPDIRVKVSGETIVRPSTTRFTVH